MLVPLERREEGEEVPQVCANFSLAYSHIGQAGSLLEALAFSMLTVISNKKPHFSYLHSYSHHLLFILDLNYLKF